LFSLATGRALTQVWPFVANLSPPPETERISLMSDTPTSPLLEVVVVTYLAEGLIGDCLESIERFAPPSTRVHVVDNASHDGTVDLVRREFPQVVVHPRDANSGFAVANNEVLRTTESEFVLLLNPDARLRAGVIDHLLSVLNSEPSIGVIGCRLITSAGEFDHAAKRNLPSPTDAAKYFLGRAIGRSLSNYTAPSVPEIGVGDVDAINGAFMLVRASAMAEVGLLDETYWMYGEDLDWCTRFRNAGWRVVYDGRVTAVHFKGATAGIRSWKLNYEFHKSMAIYYKKFSRDSRGRSAAVQAGIWAKFIITAAVDSVRRSCAKKVA